MLEIYAYKIDLNVFRFVSTDDDDNNNPIGKYNCEACVFNAVNDIHGKMHTLWWCKQQNEQKKNEKEKTKEQKQANKQTIGYYLRFRRPSRTLYTKSWNAKSTGGRVGKCDNVFGCVGTICNLIAPLFLSFSIKFSLTRSPSTIFSLLVFFFTKLDYIPQR